VRDKEAVAEEAALVGGSSVTVAAAAPCSALPVTVMMLVAEDKAGCHALVLLPHSRLPSAR